MYIYMHICVLLRVSWSSFHNLWKVTVSFTLSGYLFFRPSVCSHETTKIGGTNANLVKSDEIIDMSLEYYILFMSLVFILERAVLAVRYEVRPKKIWQLQQYSLCGKRWSQKNSQQSRYNRSQARTTVNVMSRREQGSLFLRYGHA
jgi:hypothetical protein